MHLDGCTSHFARSALSRALPEKVMEKYDELQATQALEQAGVEGLWLVDFLFCIFFVISAYRLHFLTCHIPSIISNV